MCKKPVQIIFVEPKLCRCFHLFQCFLVFCNNLYPLKIYTSGDIKLLQNTGKYLNKQINANAGLNMCDPFVPSPNIGIVIANVSIVKQRE